MKLKVILMLLISLQFYGQLYAQVYLDSSLTLNGNGDQSTPFNNIVDAFAKLSSVSGQIIIVNSMPPVQIE